MRILVTIIFCGLCQFLFAQMDHSLPLMKQLPQQTMINPSYQFDHNLVLGGSFAFRFEHSGDALKETWEVKDKTLIIDSDQWVRNLDPTNTMNTDFEIQTFLIGFKSGNFSWSINHSFRNQIFSKYSKGLAELIHFGNGPFVGDTMNLDLEMDWTSYSTLNLGLAWNTRNISIGARVHYLSGVQRLQTDPGALSLYTDDEIYQLRFQSDAVIRSASFISAEDIDRLTFEFTGVESYKWFTKNHGVALDLGATLHLGDKFDLELSVLDMGMITWDEVNELTLAKSFEFEGIDLDEVLDLDSLTFDMTLDSLRDLAGVTETTEKDYKQSLQPRIIFGAKYQFTPKWSMSGLYMNSAIGDESFSTYALGLQYEPFSWLNLGVNAAQRLERMHFGFNTSVQISFVQLFFATDHLPGLFSLNELGSSSVRFGGNLRF